MSQISELIEWALKKKEEVRDFVLHHEAESLKLRLYGPVAGGQTGERRLSYYERWL